MTKSWIRVSDKRLLNLARFSEVTKDTCDGKEKMLKFWLPERERAETFVVCKSEKEAEELLQKITQA